MHLVCLCHASRCDFDTGVEGQTITPCSGKFKAHPMTTRDAVVSEDRRLAIQIVDDDIHIAVVEKISDGETARNVFLEGVTDLPRCWHRKTSRLFD